jgi:hypothetical protein
MKLARRFSTTLQVMAVAILASGFVGGMAGAFDNGVMHGQEKSKSAVEATMSTDAGEFKLVVFV